MYGTFKFDILKLIYIIYFNSLSNYKSIKKCENYINSNLLLKITNIFNKEYYYFSE